MRRMAAKLQQQGNPMSEGNGHVIGSRPKFNVVQIPQEGVYPSSVVLPGPSGPQMLVVGGISKRLWVATQLLAACQPESGKWTSDDSLIQCVVNLTDKLIAACEQTTGDAVDKVSG